MIILQRIFLKVLYSSLAATAIILLVLLLKRMFKHRFSPRFHHILWSLVLIRLLIPFAPASNISLFNLLPNSSGNIIALEGLMTKSQKSHYIATVPTKMTKSHIKPSLTDTNGKIHQDNYLSQDKSSEPQETALKPREVDLFQRTRTLTVLTFIWLLGFLSMTVFVLISALKFSKDLKAFDKVVCPKVLKVSSYCESKLALNKPVELYCGKSFNSPFIFGILKPRIYIPWPILNKVNERELLHILLHELSHYKRRDLLCNLLSTAATMLHWFNPAVWFAMKKMRADIECACDAHVLENLRDEEATCYGMTIIKLSNLISMPYHNRTLCAYFYEGNGQIERRINMISMFRKGSYKLSAMAMIFFIALSCFTLTNAKADYDAVTTLEPAERMKEEQFNLEESHKFFTTLDRAMDFFDSDFKVPDKLPTGYEFFRITLDEERELLSVDFEKHDDTVRYTVPLEVSKNDMVVILKERYLAMSSAIVKPDIKFSEEPMSILDIKGKNLTINRNWEWSEEDLAELQKDDTGEKPEGGIGVKSLAPSEVIDKYFIWQDDGIWYSIHCCGKSTYLNSSCAPIDEIPKGDIEILLSSLKYPQDIQNVEYVSKDFKNHLEIYDNKDLKGAQEILGFAPKFPLDLPGGLAPSSSRTYEFLIVVDDEDEPAKAVKMETVFRFKDKDLPQRLSFSQTKNTLKYDEIAYNGYIDDKTSLNGGKLELTSMLIDDIKVFTYKRKVTNTNLLDKGITTVQYYVWKVNGIVYEAQFIGDMGDQQEIVKALINTH